MSAGADGGATRHRGAPSGAGARRGPHRRPRRARHLRRLGIAALVLVVVAVLVVAGGGWYFAGEVRRQALAIDPDSYQRRPVLDLTVTGSGEGRVVLAGPRDAPRDVGLAAAAGTWGLVWTGGAGVLGGDVARARGGGVSRTLDVTAGTAPGPGTTAGVVADVWSDPTAAYGAAYRDVTYPCAGATCPAWFVPAAVPSDGSAGGPAPGSGPAPDAGGAWAVMVHGKDAARTEPLRALGPVHEAGMPALVIGYRGDPGAPDPDGRHAYGATEWRDLDAAVRWAGEHGARRVVLFGSSMGGAIVASSLEHAGSGGTVGGVEVVGVVLDSPALDLGASVAQGADQLGLPGAAPVAERVASWRYGVGFDAVDYLPGTWLDVPALVFHGTADATVPVALSDELAAAHPDLVREVRVPGAGHVQSWNADPGAYERAEAQFLAEVDGA